MRARTTTITILLASLMLAGCGGGGGSEGGSPVTVVSGAPAPVPTPTPTPAPTPTPTPVASNPLAPYGTPCDGFATTVKSVAMAATIRLDRADRAPDSYIYSSNNLVLMNFDKGIEYRFDARTRRASVDQNWKETFGFAADRIVDSGYSFISYRDGSSSFLVTCQPNSAIAFQTHSVDLDNPALGVKETSFRMQMSGVPTATTAEVASGSYAATLPIRLFRTDVKDPTRRTEALVNAQPAQLFFDKNAGTITGTIRMAGTETVELRIDVTRQIGTRFTGTLYASDGSKGEISGGFYGAGGREIGFVTTFEKFGIHYVGAGSGIRN